MKRSCVEISTKNFIKENPHYSDIDIKFYIDENNFEDIAEVLQSNKRKYYLILNVIYSGKYLDEIYGNEKVSKGVEVKAMKFKTKLNERIYCKEFYDKGKRIVMLMSYYKKSQSVNKKLKNKLEKINEYEYEF